MVAPLAMDSALLRALLPAGIKIVPGRALMARVASADGSGRGSLSIAGFIIDAELPKGVRGGQDLRLVVREVSAQRVVLAIADHPESPVAAPAPPPDGSIPLPGGGRLQVTEREADTVAADHPGSHTLTLRYTTPALGAVDLRLSLDPAALSVGVSVAPGAVLEMATGEADALRGALGAAVQRSVSVTVGPRRESLDLLA